MSADNAITGLPGESKALQQYALHSDAFRPMHLAKNQLLCPEGSVCDKFVFVVSGILHHGIEIDADQKTTYLALRNSFTTALESFMYRVPAKKSIRALVATELLYIDRETFESLLQNDISFKDAYFDLIQRQICLIDDYRIDLLTLTPEERYEKLLATEPELLQHIPLHLLASFLGISMRHMSRIRKNVK